MSGPPGRRRLATACVVGALLAAAPGLPAAAAPREPGPRADPRYAGSAACRPCHAQAFAAWAASDHARAMEPATSRTVRGDFRGARVRGPGGETRFVREGGRFLVWTRGPQGQPGRFPVRYTFGIDPLQQYLLPLPGGRLQAFTVAWDTRDRRWIDLYPDPRIDHRDVLHWTRPAHNWNDRCADCHATGLRKQYDAAADGYATTWIETGAGCEACHGPAAAHVEWARTAGAAHVPGAAPGLRVRLGGGSAAWEPEPASGTARPVGAARAVAEVEVCARCHARRTTLTDAGGPGEPLLDTHRPALLEEGLYFADGQILDEVYEWGSFLQSRMYAAGVRCSDCHEPHEARLRRPGDAACAPCHAAGRFATPAHHRHPPGSEAARCVACHMPARTYMVVDPRRDHGFRVPRPDLAATTGSPDPCTACHHGRDAAWAAAAIREWTGGAARRGWHFGEALQGARAWRADGQAGLLRALEDAATPAIARATAVTLLPRYPGPRAAAALARAAADSDPLLRLAAVDAADMLPAAARARVLAPLLDDPRRAVRIDAGAALAAVPAAALSETIRAARDRAVGEYRAIQQENADRPDARLNLGLLALALGRPDEARAEYEAALRIEPCFVPAYVNLADLHRAAGREADAEAILRQGLARVPDAADLHHALGLALARRGDAAAAVAALRRAATLAPDEPRHAYAYAVALHSTGDTAGALATLRAAHGRWPGYADVIVALATISRDAGDRAAARRYAEALRALRPDDPGAQALLRQLAGP